MPKNSSTKYGYLTDPELVQLIQQNSDFLGEVYKRCKQYSISFMRKMTNGTKNDYELDDVFHDAILVLYEKIIKGNFELTASLQTYMNSVCRNILLNIMKDDSKSSNYDEHIGSEDDDDNPTGFTSTITDVLDELEDTKESQLTAIESALEKIKDAGGHCYELLTLFWYHNKSHIEIAQIMNYSNDKTSKKQKSGCQEKLRKMAFNELNN